MSFAAVIESDLRDLAAEVKKKAPQIKKDAESGIETLLVLVKKHPSNIKKVRSTDYVTPFIDCLNNEKVSANAHAIAVAGLTHVVSYNLISDATASTIVDIMNDKLSEEDPSSELGMSIAKLFPVLLEKTSFVIPDRKVQGVFGYLAKVLCAEDESSDIYADALICMNEFAAALCKQVAVFLKDAAPNPSAKTYSSIREKAPKSLSDITYASVCWSFFQDLVALLIGQTANWFSNGGNAKTVALGSAVAGKILLNALESEHAVVLSRVEFSSLFDLVLMPAVLEQLNDDKSDCAMMAATLTAIQPLCTAYYSVIPSINTMMETMTGKLRHWAKKKKSVNTMRCVYLQFLRNVLSGKEFFEYCLMHYSENTTALVEQLCAVLQFCYSKCSLDEMARVFEIEREQGEEITVRGSEECGYENAFLFALMGVKRVSEACVESVKRNVDEKLMTTLQSFVPSCLLPLSETYEQLLKAHCGENVFRFVLLSQAALIPLYGALKMSADQLKNAFSLCKLALPSMSAHEVKKRSADTIFSYKNLAAIEALPAICAGNGEGVSGVWRLVEATMEVVEEYIPGKDTENNYLSASTPIVCAEYEIIEEQFESLLATCSGYSAKGLKEVLEVLIAAAQRGMRSESISGRGRLFTEWKQICEENKLEFTVDDDYKTKPCQSGSALAHLLPIITKRVGELPFMLPALTELLLEMTTTLKRHASIPALTQPTFLFVSAVLQQINDGHAEVETLKASMADLLKVTSNLLTGKTTQTIALEAVYDVIIQGDCLKGNWKPIISGLKKVATSENCSEAFSDVQLILDDFINEMDLSEVLSLGALIAAYTRQGHDINIALSAIGLYWKLADYTLISAREARPGDRPEIVRKMRQEIITTILPTCMDNRPNIRNTAIQTLFQILILQRGGFIFDDYLEVVESVTSLASKLDRIRVHGYQEGDTTPVDDQESIRRHHTRDTVEKQFNETFCHLLKGISRLMKLFVQHLLKKVQGDAVMEYMKVYKSMMKFFGKCMMIKEGKEVPMTVLSLIVEMMGWIKDELMNNEKAMTMFSLTIGRLFETLSNNELGNNTEADDMLSSMGTTLISIINDYAFILLDPDYTFFQPLLNVLIAMVKTDGVALRSGSGGKYNTNRPKGKMDTIQKWILEALKAIYNHLKDNGKFLIDYKTFTTALDSIQMVAREDNATHANDVFIVIMEEFTPTLMKRKEARALARTYLAEEAAREAADREKRLGGSILEEHPIFAGITRENSEVLLETIKGSWTKLEEMNDGDAAKTLAFFVVRNASILGVVMGDAWLTSVMKIMRESVVTATEKLVKENDVERKIFLDNAMESLASLACGKLEDGDGKKNASIIDTPCAELPTEMCLAAKKEFMRMAKKVTEMAAPVLIEGHLVSDLRNVILGLIELVKKVDSEEEWKTSSEMLKNCGDVAVSQAVSALYN